MNAKLFLVVMGLGIQGSLASPGSQQVLKDSFSSHGPANLPVTNPTSSFWIDSPGANPLGKEGSEGPLTEDADVCIIGSGITGVSAAYHLAKLVNGHKDAIGLKTVILEARDFCSGATGLGQKSCIHHRESQNFQLGRNGGHLTPATFLGFKTWTAAYGMDYALRSLALENHTSAGILRFLNKEHLGDAVDLVAGGHVTMFTDKIRLDAARADFHAAQKAGVNISAVEWLSERQMEQLFGTSHPGVRFPGHNLWPLKLVTHLYKHARSMSSKFSLTLHTHTPVTSISPIHLVGSNRRWRLDTPRGSIACGSALHATNAHASHLLPHLSGPHGIVPTRGQIVATRSSASQEALTKTGWSAAGFAYWFPRPISGADESPLVILGGARDASPTGEAYEEDDSILNGDIGSALKKFLPLTFPGKFKGKRPEMEWGSDFECLRTN
jgi:glycine/D-amino acid oxidase-like deaminating enzyme